MTLGWVTTDPRQAVALEQNSSAEMGTEKNGSIVKQREDNCLLLSGDGDGAEQLRSSVVAKDREWSVKEACNVDRLERLRSCAAMGQGSEAMGGR